MVEPGQRPRFDEEAVERRRAGRRVEELDGDGAFGGVFVGEVDGAHAARAEAAQKIVARRRFGQVVADVDLEAGGIAKGWTRQRPAGVGVSGLELDGDGMAGRDHLGRPIELRGRRRRHRRGRSRRRDRRRARGRTRRSARAQAFRAQPHVRFDEQGAVATETGAGTRRWHEAP